MRGGVGSVVRSKESKSEEPKLLGDTTETKGRRSRALDTGCNCSISALPSSGVPAVANNSTSSLQYIFNKLDNTLIAEGSSSIIMVLIMS